MNVMTISRKTKFNNGNRKGNGDNNKRNLANPPDPDVDPPDPEENSEFKPLTRSFRLAKNLDEAIISSAAKLRLTPSALLNQILRSYFIWYQYASGDGSPFVMVNDQLLLALLENVDEIEIERIARSAALDSTKDFIRFRRQKLDLDSLLEFIEIVSRYMNIGTFGIVNGSGWTEIRVRHSLGKKWSVFIGALLSALFEEVLGTNVESTASATGVSLALSVTVPVR
jgi:hypothetical protein